MRSVAQVNRSVDRGGIVVRHREAAGLYNRESARSVGKSAGAVGNGVGFRKCDSGRHRLTGSCKTRGTFIAVGGGPCAGPDPASRANRPIGRHCESTEMSGVAYGIEMVITRRRQDCFQAFVRALERQL